MQKQTSSRVSLMKCCLCESRICSQPPSSGRARGLQQGRPPDVVQGCWNTAWHMGFLHSAHIVQINRREATSNCIFGVKLKVVFPLENNNNFVMVFCGARIISTEIRLAEPHVNTHTITLDHELCQAQLCWHTSVYVQLQQCHSFSVCFIWEGARKLELFTCPVLIHCLKYIQWVHEFPSHWS